MRVVAAILAAGSSSRLGQDKTLLELGGKPVWRWSFETYSLHPLVHEVVLVGSHSNMESLRQSGASVVLGGDTRQQSALRALESVEGDAILYHDAARPFVKPSLISGVVEAIGRSGAAAVGTAVTDTIKQSEDGVWRTLDRTRLVAMQTPQGALTELLRRAHAAATSDATDDMALLEAIGVQPEIVDGDPGNFKITTAEDLERARRAVAWTEHRTGIGYDVHPFSDDPSRTLMLGGVAFPGHKALDGHSDADVLLHAATDALLGAAAMGDIGQHFPNTDLRWKGEASLTFLRTAGDMLYSAGWNVANLDVTVVAESPKVMPHALRIRYVIAAALGLSVDRVSLKATTNERLGFVGRGEGIAALAVATVRR